MKAFLKKHDNFIKTTIGVIVGFLLLMLICGIFSARNERRAGRTTPEDVISAYAQTLKDPSGLSDLVYITDPNGPTLVQQLTAHANKLNTIVSVDTQGVDINKLATDVSEEVHENIPNVELQDTGTYYVEIPITHDIDGGTYNVLAGYFITVYKTHDKWYLYDASQDMVYVKSGTDADGNDINPDEALRLFNSSFIGGNSDIGYIPLDDTWVPYQTNSDETLAEAGSVISETHYQQDSGEAAIHLIRIHSDQTADALASLLIDNLQKNDEIAADIGSETIADLPARRVRCYNENTGMYFIAYLLDAPDGDVRYLSIDATEDYLAGYVYLIAFILPAED